MNQHPEVLQMYKRQKLIKFNDHGFANWSKNEKLADQAKVMAFMKNKQNWNEVFEMPEVVSIF